VLDPTTPGGRLVFHIFGALAEFERDLIRERTRAGLAAARARGRRGGLPTVMTQEKTSVARQLYDSREHTVAAIRLRGLAPRETYVRHLLDQAITAQERKWTSKEPSDARASTHSPQARARHLRRRGHRR
jgi:DNA invertase Pin-like site-specific DNA recombinase